ncbi:DUF4013 domain-containing protein [Halostella sp. JP-L12]|uniref:DUF4013 domain-containing protein n=1 Tax=Halostella TaxID=1843185 RepID=UPI000EF8002A|nr:MULTISPECIES: DUF4013 domain-containing protein [Halostella]NHN47776.1 DUF4013 domain-containing protein [Halostella sp. JP-L12]
MFTASLSYLRNTEGWERTAVIGGLLGAFSFLVIPAFAATGYLLRVLRETMRGDDEGAPAFDDWEAMTVDGLKAAVIGLAYAFLPSALFAVAATAGVAGLLSGSDAGAVTGGLVLIASTLVAAVLALASAYVLPAAILNYADKGRIGAGFAAGEVGAMLVSREYATAFGYALVLGIAVGLAGGVLNAVPVLGYVATAFVAFYAAVASAWIFGTAYAEMYPVDVTAGSDGAPDERVVV